MVVVDDVVVVDSPVLVVVLVLVVVVVEELAVVEVEGLVDVVLVVLVVGGASAQRSSTFRPLTMRSAQNAPVKLLARSSRRRACGAEKNASMTP